MAITAVRAQKELRRRAAVTELEKRASGFGLRADKTIKGKGFFGELQLPDGRVATEYSIGVEFDGKETQIPSLVLTLTEEEKNLMVNDIIPNRKQVPDNIVQKAIDHAKQRIGQGKSPFAQEGEQNIPTQQTVGIQDAIGQQALTAGVSPQDVIAGETATGIRAVPVQPKLTPPEKPTLPPRQFQGPIDEFVRAIGRGSLNIGSGLLTTFAQVGQASIFNVERIDELAEKAREISQKPKFQPGTDGGVKGFVANAVGDALPFMAGVIAATITTGPVGGFGVAFAVEGNDAFQSALEEGATQEQAEIEGFVVGSINAALELLQVERVLKFAKIGKGSIKTIAKAAKDKALKKIAKATGKLGKEAVKTSITEGIQEALQETTSVLAPAITGRELPTAKEAAKRIGQAGLGGAVVGPILGGAGAVTQAITQREAPIAPKVAEVAEKPPVRPTVTPPETPAGLAAAEKQGAKPETGIKVPPKPTQAKPEAVVKIGKEVTELPPEQTATEKTPQIQTKISETVETDFTKATSAKQASLAEDRKSMGLDEINSKSRRGWEEALRQAKDEKIASKANRIAEEVNATPRALSDVETAGVTIRLAELKNEHKEAMEAIAKATDDTDIKTKSAEVGRIELEFDALTRAVDTSGTEKGRALAAQKLTINKDFSLISVLNRAKAAAGKKLTEGKQKLFKALTIKLDQTTKRVESLEQEVAELSAKSAIRRGNRRFKTMTLQQKNRSLDSLVTKTKTLLDEGCNN